MSEKKTSFKTKVLLPIISIFTASIIIISIIDYRALYSTVKAKTNANLDMFTGSMLEQINHLNIILSATKETLNLKHIATAKAILQMLEDTDYKKTTDDLIKLAEEMDILEINIVNSDAMLVNSNIKEFIGFNYRATKPTLIYIGLVDGTLSELTEEPRISVVEDGDYGVINHYVGIARPNGKGFIQVGFNADIIKKLSKEINIEKTIRETKIGANGYGIVLANGIDLSGKDVSDEKWYRAVSSGNGFAWIEMDGQKLYAGYKNAESNTVVGLVPEGDFYEELRQVLIEKVIFLFIAIVVMIIVVYFVLGRLLLPINYLVRGLEKIAKGNLDARIRGNYNDEFDKIKDAVNSMAADIQKQIAVISGIEYASKIQRNLLPADSVLANSFSDYSVIWKPRDVVGGDIYWAKQFDKGAVLCVCDCTGHGTPGALLTTLVVSALEAVVWPINCEDTAGIIWKIDERLARLFSSGSDADVKDGCDLVVLFIAKNGSVALSAGRTNVFICDGKGVQRFKGQKISVGEGNLRSRNDVKTLRVSANPDNKFYIASDGLFDQPGGELSRPFGYKALEKIILENHNEKQSVISDKIWTAFEGYRGAEPRVDDFELITFKP
jgi:HAMP domain-containing protein